MLRHDKHRAFRFRNLGPGYIIVAYLDDIFILSSDPYAINKVQGFIASQDSPMSLNVAKSKTTPLASIAQEGAEILGSFVGPPAATAQFLRGKFDAVQAKLRAIASLSCQDQLLLLRYCIQQDLRHLQRSLPPEDALQPVWRELDGHLARAASHVRGSAPELAELDSALLQLPIHMGGLGILSHHDVAPHAFAAAAQNSERVLADFAPIVHSHPDAAVKSQRARCQEMFALKHKHLLSELSPQQRVAHLEASSPIGRAWLSLFPSHPMFRLRDQWVRSALCYRALLPGPSVCPACGRPAAFAHPEICPSHNYRTTTRHNDVQHALGKGLRSLPNTEVTLEPQVPFTSRRDDILTTTAGSTNLCDIELRGMTPGSQNASFDLCVGSLFTATARDRWRRLEAPLSLAGDEPTATAAVTSAIELELGEHATRKRNRHPASDTPFFPLIMSSGGILNEETSRIFDSWKTSLPAATFRFMINCVAVALLKSRG